MPTITTEIEVWCSCGNGLCNQSETKSNRYGNCTGIVIEPCKRCLEQSYDEGYQDAIQED